MPPKKGDKPAAPAKTAIDKTFGLKNKNRSNRVQRYVAEVQQQQAQKGVPRSKIDADRAAKTKQEEKQKADQARKEELEKLFNEVVIDQKVPYGVDPKSVLCVNFKAGKCQKGDKCKFSHDLGIERRTQKRDIYTDARDEESTTSKTAYVDDGRQTASQTDKICKHFLEAVESGHFGWFWQCPNGDKCIYKHALPQGYVLKSQITQDDDEQKLTMEQFIEEERHKLPPLTQLKPVNDDNFTVWRRNKNDEEEKELKLRLEKERMAGKVSGKSFFLSDSYKGNAEDAEDESEEAWDFAALRKETEEAEQQTEVSGDGADGTAEEKEGYCNGLSEVVT